MVKKLDRELSGDTPAAFSALLDAAKLREFGFAELANLVDGHPVRVELGSVKLLCDDPSLASLVLGNERFAEFLEREFLFEQHGIRAYGLRFQASNAFNAKNQWHVTPYDDGFVAKLVGVVTLDDPSIGCSVGRSLTHALMACVGVAKDDSLRSASRQRCRLCSSWFALAFASRRNVFSQH